MRAEPPIIYIMVYIWEHNSVLVCFLSCKRKLQKENMFSRLGVRRLRKTRVQIGRRPECNFSSFDGKFQKTTESMRSAKNRLAPHSGYATGVTQRRRAGRLLAERHDPVQVLRARVTPCSKKGERAPLGPAP